MNGNSSADLLSAQNRYTKTPRQLHLLPQLDPLGLSAAVALSIVPRLLSLAPPRPLSTGWFFKYNI
jgi:hypothetical protein